MGPKTTFYSLELELLQTSSFLHCTKTMLGSKDRKHTQAPTPTKMAKPSVCHMTFSSTRQVISDLSVASTNVGDIACDSMTIKTSHSLSKLSYFPQEITAV